MLYKQVFKMKYWQEQVVIRKRHQNNRLDMPVLDMYDRHYFLLSLQIIIA